MLQFSSNWLQLLEKDKSLKKSRDAKNKLNKKNQYISNKSRIKKPQKLYIKKPVKQLIQMPVLKAVTSAQIKATATNLVQETGFFSFNQFLNTDKELTLQDIKNLNLEKQNDLLNVNQHDSEKRKSIGRYVSLDCEFVGVGLEGSESALARVSIVNFYGHVLLDSFVKPLEKVVDWRTHVSGVTAAHMKNAILFKEAQQQTANILEDRVLIGHAVHHDLKALLLKHPSSMTRDTSLFPPFRAYSKGKTPSLKKLSQQILGKEIQKNEHSSVEDARATVVLYRLYKKEFEKFNFKFKNKQQ